LFEELREYLPGNPGFWSADSYPDQHHELVELARLLKSHSALHGNVKGSGRNKLPAAECDQIRSIDDPPEIATLIAHAESENEKIREPSISC
jgi:hypothetical protein